MRLTTKMLVSDSVLGETQKQESLDLRFLNIVIVNDFAHVNGGAAKVAIGSAVGLAERGHTVTFLSAVRPVAPELDKPRLRVQLTDQYDIKGDPNRFRAATQGLWNHKAMAAIRDAVQEFDPEKTIIHIHGWSKALSSSVARQVGHQRFPIVLTLHDYFYACPNGGFFNFQTNKICELRALSAACVRENCDRDGYSQKLWRTVRQVIQNRYGFADAQIKHFISLSHLSEQLLRPYLPEGATLYRVPNPVEMKKEQPVAVGDNAQFVAVGRLSPEKGFALLAAATASIQADVTFVGDGPERSRIKSIYPRATITGWQPASVVEKYLRSARALVLPSLWYEAQPVSVLEAAAVGLPSIVPDDCAARELVDDGETGFWFRGGDLTDLVHKMTLLQDVSTAATMGRRAFERYWEQPFTMERHIKSLENCYRSVLQSRNQCQA